MVFVFLSENIVYLSIYSWSLNSMSLNCVCTLTLGYFFIVNNTVLNTIQEKAMAPHSNTLAWKILWMEEPGGLQSMGSQSRTWLSDFTFTLFSLVAQRLKFLPPMRETRVRSLGQEDSLENEMLTHSSILAWRIPWTEKPGRLQSMGSQRVGHNWEASLTHLLNTSYLIKSLVGN